MSVDYPRKPPFGAVICLWAATVLGSWVLVVFVVAGLWWIVT